MALDAPTVDQFMTRFPSFAGKEDQAAAILSEIVTTEIVNDTWRTQDQRIAIQYLMAHMLSTEGDADSLPVTSESLGPISTTYFFSEAMLGINRTEYGRRFAALAKGNGQSVGSGIMVVGGNAC